jgi:hypothetical protein
MLDPTSSQPLAHAFLTLADDGSKPAPRSLPVAVAAAVAAVTLALAVPLGWLAEHPIAVLGSKSHVSLLDDEAA